MLAMMLLTALPGGVVLTAPPDSPGPQLPASAASGNVRPVGYIGLLRDLGMPAVVARAVLGG
jgi:hypothetical protein